MPAAKTNPSSRSEPEAPAASAPKRHLNWRWLLSPPGLAALIGASVVLHAVGFLYNQRSHRAPAPAAVHEIALGTFRFEQPRADEQRPPSGVTAAEFALYLTLVDQVKESIRPVLDARWFRVRQDIEQLLRQAHSGDFEEATLTGLKRQLREQVNETLGTRAVGDVIVTDLKLHHSAVSPRRPDQSSQAAAPADAPWLEKPR